MQGMHVNMICSDANEKQADKPVCPAAPSHTQPHPTTPTRWGRARSGEAGLLYAYSLDKLVMSAPGLPDDIRFLVIVIVIIIIYYYLLSPPPPTPITHPSYSAWGMQ